VGCEPAGGSKTASEAANRLGLAMIAGRINALVVADCRQLGIETFSIVWFLIRLLAVALPPG